MRVETVPADWRGVERKGDLLTWGDCVVCADGEGIEIHYRPGSLRSLHYLDRCPRQAARLAMLATAGLAPSSSGTSNGSWRPSSARWRRPTTAPCSSSVPEREGGGAGRPGHTAVSSSLSFSSSSSRARCNRCQPLREQACRISAGPCRVEG